MRGIQRARGSLLRRMRGPADPRRSPGRRPGRHPRPRRRAPPRVGRELAPAGGDV